MKAISTVVAAICGIVSLEATAQTRVAYVPTAGPAQWQPSAPTPEPANSAELFAAQDIASKIAADAPFVANALLECSDPIPASQITAMHQNETGFCPGKPIRICPCSAKGACTPMQLMPETIRIFGKPGEDPETLADSMKIAVRHLCQARGRGNAKLDPASDAAILRYNASSEYLRDIRRIQASHEPIWAAIMSGKGPIIAQAMAMPYAGPLTLTTAEGKTLTVSRIRGGAAFPVGWGDCYITSVEEEERPGGREHKGIDIACPTGTPVYAVQDGVVTNASWNHGTAAGERAGIHVRIIHNIETKTPGELSSSGSMHLDRAAVRSGQQVRKGDLIGYVGATAVYNSGPHLHFQMEQWGPNGEMTLVTNPFIFLNGTPYDPSAEGMYKGPPAPRYAEKFRPPLAQNP